MHKFLLTVTLFLVTGAALFAQLPSPPKPKPLAIRRVNGVVRDSLGKVIPAAAVRLIAASDTLHTLTSEYGVFNFPEVRSVYFTLEVQMAGYHPYFKKYFLNDVKPILVLPPLVLTSSLVQLKGITVTTEKGPQQRGDTTEFWAKDYIVRDYARLEDMLKRMEGFSTDANGMLSYNGKPVNKALFNGTKYFDGDVAAAIKELPADIVERIQVIQDNEDGTGPKKSMSAASSQTLNIVTKPDKSAARMYQASAAAGTQDRYTGVLSAKSLDGNRMWGIGVSNTQEPLGIKREAPLGTISNMMERMVSAWQTGGSGGMLKGSAARLNYNDRIGKMSYSVAYLFNRTHMLNETENMTEEFYKDGSLKRNTTSREDDTRTEHGLMLSADLHLPDFSMMTQLSANTTASVSNNTTETRQTGIIDNLQRGATGMHTQTPNYRFSAMLNFFEHKKLRMSVSLNSGLNATNGSGHDNTDIYSSAGAGKPDSSLYLLQQQKISNANHAVGVTFAYGHREKYDIKLEIIPSLFRTITNNYRDQVIGDQPAKRLNDLSNDEALTNARLPVALSATYNFTRKLAVEVRGEYQTIWQQTQLRLKDLDLSTRSSFFSPHISFSYRRSNTSVVRASYQRNVNTPSLLQLNPKPYYTSPFDVMFGNPDLKNGVMTTASAEYQNFGTQSGIIVDLSGHYMFTNNGIGANRIVQVDSVTNTIRTETHYLNLKGGDTKTIRASIAKNLKPMNMMFRLAGNAQWAKQLFFASSHAEQTDQRTYDGNFTAAITPVKWLDLAPAIAYTTTSNNNSLQPGRPLFNNELTTQLTAAIFLPADVKMNINARQTVSRASSLPVSQHPFVLNANIEKRFLRKKDAIISFMVMDAFQQNNNNIITQSTTGFSNAVTNLKSRYFLFQLSWNPQQFTRSKSVIGSRRGDGSFVPVK
ncbi:MAG: TonB-dependent receptor [Chitinophaga sp.]|uniref:TonB-dependent receptor n=1 Tax=Chitinophaga sp. TaxID=1869181 RepID=UPI001B136821|nr:TonB-dependent receptor [Chitinophaga sp.]MBO9730255.1 TonB-dependent receptor [Chitinophaga sp.]